MNAAHVVLRVLTIFTLRCADGAQVIIMLPPHIGLVLLSATVPNVAEFADWVRVKATIHRVLE